jgi:hypothetical protein
MTGPDGVICRRRPAAAERGIVVRHHDPGVLGVGLLEVDRPAALPEKRSQPA